MAEKAGRRSLLSRLLPWLVVLGLGFVSGYYVRDQQHDDQLRAAVSQAEASVRAAALEAIQRGQRAGGDLGAGAQAAAESTKAAFNELMGKRDSL